MVCSRLMPAVSGLESEFAGKVRARNVDCTTEEGVKAVQELGFASHGLVIRDHTGKVLFKQPDHTVKIEEVRKALKEILSA
jgi:hypothetical protein